MSAGGLVLGGAQFGMPYGITNEAGMPDEGSIRSLLKKAHNAGVRLIDTAPAYGESESVLGRVGAAEGFGLMTKVLAGASEPDLTRMYHEVRSSLETLKTSSLEAVSFHSADVLLAPGGQALFDAARRMRDSGLYRKVGVSVYDSTQIDAVLSKCDIDMVQLPINVLDKRMITSGALDRLMDRGIEIHARSAFLQGVLLASLDDLPIKLEKLRPVLQSFRSRLAEMSLSPLEACLGVLRSMPAVDYVVVGVNSVTELEGVLAANDVVVPWDAFLDLAIEDCYLLDPRLWG